jgi:hypothetical protein
MSGSRRRSTPPLAVVLRRCNHGQRHTDLLLALLRRRPAEDTGISMQGDTALWRSWLALTPL